MHDEPSPAGEQQFFSSPHPWDAEALDQIPGDDCLLIDLTTPYFWDASDRSAASIPSGV